MLWCLTGLSSVCPIKETMTGDLEKNSSHPELDKDFTGVPFMPVTLCFWKWTGWRLSYSWRGLKSCSVSVSQQSTTQHSLQGCISTDFSGRDDIWLSYRRELYPQFSCEWWNITSSAYWESMWKWIVIALLFETGPHVTSHSLQLRITEPCPYCLCLTCARNTAMHHHAPCMWYRGFVHTRQTLSK